MSQPGTPRLGRWLLLVGLVAVAAASGWWAARATVVEPSPAQMPEAALVTAEAAPATVGRTLPLSVTVRQPVEMVAVNTLAGVVTGVKVGEGQVAVGDVLYSVAGAPVRAVQGDVPFYRDLAPGAEGDDVEQLQRALRSLGHLKDPADGKFQGATAAAVRAWQKELGIPRTGRVPLGEVVALQSLPTTVQLGEEIARGALLAGGEQGVLAPSGIRTFELVVSDEQSRLIPTEATVRVEWQGRTWTALIADSQIDENGQAVMELRGPDGGPVCADECDALPADPQLTLRSEVVVVPEVEGLGVPAAAIHTRPDASTYVLGEDGSEQDVTVVGSGSGIAIVEGLQAGDRVQVLATPDAG